MGLNFRSGQVQHRPLKRILATAAFPNIVRRLSFVLVRRIDYVLTLAQLDHPD